MIRFRNEQSKSRLRNIDRPICMLGRYQPEIICLFSFARTLKERKKNNERKMDKHKYNECAISILTHHFFFGRVARLRPKKNHWRYTTNIRYLMHQISIVTQNCYLKKKSKQNVKQISFLSTFTRPTDENHSTFNRLLNSSCCFCFHSFLAFIRFSAPSLSNWNSKIVNIGDFSNVKSTKTNLPS